MLKHDARKLVQDRATTRYPKSVVTVLGKIIDLTHVGDWREDHIEQFFSTPTTVSKLEFLTNLEWHTVSRALKILLRDGVIKAHPQVKDSFGLNPETLQSFASKFLTLRSRSLDRKVLKAVRMKFTRNPNREAQQYDIHPVGCPCVCVPYFCSQPSTI